MTAESRDIARQLVACSMFRWAPGMLTTDGTRVSGVDADGMVKGTTPAGYRKDGTLKWPEHRSFSRGFCLPDLDDPATLGCLLALVREAWGGTVWTQGALASGRIRWIVGGLHRDSSARVNGDGFDTEAEALVTALEGAPRQTRGASNPAGTW